MPAVRDAKAEQMIHGLLTKFIDPNTGELDPKAGTVAYVVSQVMADGKAGRSSAAPETATDRALAADAARRRFEERFPDAGRLVPGSGVPDRAPRTRVEPETPAQREQRLSRFPHFNRLG